MNELIGPLGLPGAIVAIFAAVFFGVKIRNEFLAGGRSESSYSLKDATQLATGLSARVDLAERSIQENVSETRHSINNNLEKVIDRLASEMNHQTNAIVAALTTRLKP